MDSLAGRVAITGGGAVAVAAAVTVVALAIVGALSPFQAGILLVLVMLLALVAGLGLLVWRTLQAIRHTEDEIKSALQRYHTPAEPIVAAVRAEAADLSATITDLAEQHRVTSAGLSKHVDAVRSDLGERIAEQVKARTEQDDEQQHALTTRLDRLHQEEQQLYWQLEALLDLRSLLPPRAPMPPLRGWAASPDVLHWMLIWAHYHHPRRIVECGSGVSTVLFGYHVKHTGTGTVIALEHDGRYAARTRELAQRHSVADVVKVREAPLTEWQHGDRTWQWYDRAAVEDIPEIDLLFIDGPPQATGDIARFPAGPVLMGRLAPDGVAVSGRRTPARRVARQRSLARASAGSPA